jgi:hypothetical protein
VIQVVLAINEQDCTIGDGNTAEECEAIAVTLLRTAQAIRSQEEGTLECIGHDGKVLAWVHLHVCGPTCDERRLNEPPTIERFESVGETLQPLRALSISIIEQYRRVSNQ